MDLDYLLSEGIRVRVSTLVDGLSRGAPENYQEYCKLVGEIRGLRYAEQLLSEARQRLTVGDEA